MIDVDEHLAEHVVLGELRECGIIRVVRVRAVVDDSVHIEVQVVCSNRADTMAGVG